MKITKKVKISIFIIWMTAITTMVVGTCIIGQNYMSATYGEDHSFKFIYTTTDPMNDVYNSVSSLREKLLDTVKANPDIYKDKEYMKSINQEASENNTFIIVKVNADYVYSGITELTKELADSLDAEYEDGNINAVDERVVNEEDTSGLMQFKVQEYLMTKPSMYLCNHISYSLAENKINIYMLTYYGNYVKEFRGAVVGNIIMMMVIMCVLSGVVAFLVYRKFVNPLVKLKQAADRIGEGNLSEVVDTGNHSSDEIGELCDSFEDMRQKLSDYANDKMRYEEENRQLISNISHDLRTPITTIKGYVEGIMDGVADTPEKQERYLKMIYSKANEMDALINELSLYTNINNNAIPYEFHRVPVKDYFGDCMEEVQATLLSRNMQLTYNNACPPEVKVIVDPDQLRRVINNIITNSIKYNDKEIGKVNIDIREEDTEVVVDISDNGRGVDEESLPKIFDRLYRADSARQSRGGSGLGLAICKKIIEEHGGRIWARSKKGEGMTISFTLKKYIKQPEIATSPEEKTEEPTKKGSRSTKPVRKKRREADE
jgi:signal transduction histidine kinase